MADMASSSYGGGVGCVAALSINTMSSWNDDDNNKDDNDNDNVNDNNNDNDNHP